MIKYPITASKPLGVLSVLGLLLVSTLSSQASANQPPVSTLGNPANIQMGRFENWVGPVPALFRDPDGGAIQDNVSILRGPTYGKVTALAGSIYYIPLHGFTGNDSIVVQAYDSTGAASGPVTYNFSINGSMNPAGHPITSNTYIYTVQGQQGWGGALCANTPGTPVAAVYSQPSVGSASYWANLLVYNPNGPFIGTTGFTYACTRDNYPFLVSANMGYVSVYVGAQVALSTQEDTPKAVDIGSYPGLTYQITQQPANGSAYVSGSSIVFTPNANWNGSTSLNYNAVYAGGGGSLTYSIPISVSPVNDAPSASDQTMSLLEDTSATITLPVSDVDLSFEGDSHTWHIVTPPNSAHGSATITGDRLTFTPAPDWFGTTYLTYKIRDRAGAESNVATVTITVTPVNDVPVVNNIFLATDEDTPGTVKLTATDIDSSPPFTFEMVSQSPTLKGTGKIDGDILTFTPYKDWNGTTALSYRAMDKEGGWSLPATVQITVNPINDVPALRSPLKIEARENVPVKVKAVVTKQ
ncbi:tandem-95 repeat protein [Pseudomonas frederiksbergensis]|uniref:tandem-95 repeat protein n=1 Tax=Pseudomonas frederiksbergensis TaxID=104087 RepID=UPI0009D73965|nr:tandem-95 repeat protein [Pseudomonas frederiksbergensis]